MSHALTDEEFFRLHGTLTPERIDRLLATVALLPSVDTAIVKIKEARASLAGDDWFEPMMKEIRELGEHLKGQNKERFKKLSAAADDFAMTQFYSADHARSELNDAIASLTSPKADSQG